MDRPTQEIEKLKACTERDACEREDCAYYLTPPEVAEVLRYIEELEKTVKEQKAEIEEIYENPGEWLAGL